MMKLLFSFAFVLGIFLLILPVSLRTNAAKEPAVTTQSVDVTTYKVKPHIVIPNNIARPGNIADIKAAIMAGLAEVSSFYSSKLSGHTFLVDSTVDEIQSKNDLIDSTYNTTRVALYNLLGTLSTHAGIVDIYWILGSGSVKNTGGMLGSSLGLGGFAAINHDNLLDLTSPTSTSARNIALGIISHELGHAFGLATERWAGGHPCTVVFEVWCKDGAPRPLPVAREWDYDIMGYGLYSYPIASFNNTDYNSEILQLFQSRFINPNSDPAPTTVPSIRSALAINSVSPNPLTQGQILEIRGSDFGSAQGNVKIVSWTGGLTLPGFSIISWTDTLIRIQTQPNAITQDSSTSWRVTITNADRSAEATKELTIAATSSTPSTTISAPFSVKCGQNQPFPQVLITLSATPNLTGQLASAYTGGNGTGTITYTISNIQLVENLYLIPQAIAGIPLAQPAAFSFTIPYPVPIILNYSSSSFAYSQCPPSLSPEPTPYPNLTPLPTPVCEGTYLNARCSFSGSCCSPYTCSGGYCVLPQTPTPTPTPQASCRVEGDTCTTFLATQITSNCCSGSCTSGRCTNIGNPTPTPPPGGGSCSISGPQSLTATRLGGNYSVSSSANCPTSSSTCRLRAVRGSNFSDILKTIDTSKTGFYMPTESGNQTITFSSIGSTSPECWLPIVVNPAPVVDLAASISCPSSVTTDQFAPFPYMITNVGAGQPDPTVTGFYINAASSTDHLFGGSRLANAYPVNDTWTLTGSLNAGTYTAYLYANYCNPDVYGPCEPRIDETSSSNNTVWCTFTVTTPTPTPTPTTPPPTPTPTSTPTPTTVPPCTLSFSADATNIPNNSSTTLRWSSTLDSDGLLRTSSIPSLANWDGDFKAGNTANSSESTGILTTGNYTYNLTCHNNLGFPVSRSVTITVGTASTPTPTTPLTPTPTPTSVPTPTSTPVPIPTSTSAPLQKQLVRITVDGAEIYPQNRTGTQVNLSQKLYAAVVVTYKDTVGNTQQNSFNIDFLRPPTVTPIPTAIPTPTPGSITLAGSSQSTSGTWTQDCGTGSNRMLIVTTAEWRGDTSSQVSDITYATGADNYLTRLGQSYNTATGALVTMWYKKAPASGSNTVSAVTSTPSDTAFGSSCWSNVSQADLSIGGGNYGNSSSPTTNAFYAATEDVVVDGISVLGSQTLSVPDGRQVFANTARGNARVGHSSKAGSTSTSFIPMSWTNAGGDGRFAMIAAVLKPAGSVIPPTPTSSAPTPTPTSTYQTPSSVEQSSCNMNLTEGQTVSGQVLTTTTGTRSNSSYYLSLWTIGSKYGDFQLFVSQSNGPMNGTVNSAGFYNNGPATLECRIQTTQSGESVIFRRQVNVNVQN